MMAEKLSFGRLGNRAEALSKILCGEIRGCHICAATRSVGSVILLKFGPLSDVLDPDDITAAKAYKGWEWSIFIDSAPWALMKNGQCITSSENDGNEIDAGLKWLVGTRVDGLEISERGTLALSTQAALTLEVEIVQNDETVEPDETVWTIFRRTDWAVAYAPSGELRLELYDHNPKRN